MENKEIKLSFHMLILKNQSMYKNIVQYTFIYECLKKLRRQPTLWAR